MVNWTPNSTRTHQFLSVLALSSRFDGQDEPSVWLRGESVFQYSLCRVVLMVPPRALPPSSFAALSVLALSSRFDGRRNRKQWQSHRSTFSTRSVESF